MGGPISSVKLGALLVKRRSDIWVHAMCHIVGRLFLIFILSGRGGESGKGAAPLQLICECETPELEALISIIIS